ncbi:helix-turn-helix domain-containing protein [Providencia sp. Je.9.19]|uniref:helix-turn-helix domain-containing protein n=1 Tax=unclassified Providencia TaxID=2633465 RepID=UPI003DA83DBF
MNNDYTISEIIGNKIKLLRKEKGLSLTHVAKIIGISEQQQLRYERGTNRISIDRLKQYSDFFNKNIIYFFNFNDFEKKEIENHKINNKNKGD